MTRQGTLPLLALALGGFVFGTAEFTMMGLLTEAARGFEVDVAAAGQFITAYAVGVAVGAPLLMVVAVVLGLRPSTMLVVFLTILTVGVALCVVAPTFETMLAGRFISGLPHGAFFGLAVIVAVNISPPGRAARSTAVVFAGLTVANVLGAPAATLLGQLLGWRSAFAAMAVLGLVSAVSMYVAVPRSARLPTTKVSDEFAVMLRPQVILYLLIALAGTGGMFAAYSYVSPLLTEGAGLNATAVPPVLLLYGLGMTAGNFLVGRHLDSRPALTLYVVYGLLISLLLATPVMGRSPVLAPIWVFGLGTFGFALVPLLQARILAASAGAPLLAAGSIHSAFNIANALGAALGGLVIAQGYGFFAPGLVGAALSISGLALVLVSSRWPDKAADRRRS